MADNTNKKFYTFLHTNKSVSNNGKEFTDITTVLVLRNPNTRDTGNGHVVTTCSAAIQNRGKRLSEVLDAEIAENDNGSVFVDVTFWDNRSERFNKFLNGRDSVRVCVVGSVSLRTFEKRDGTDGQRISINADDWFLVPAASKD